MEAPILLEKLKIHNYKSLRNVSFRPEALTVLIGPNAAGKSNFADAIDFLSGFYMWSLVKAIRSKGGISKISFRNQNKLDACIQLEASFYIPQRGTVGYSVGEWGNYEAIKQYNSNLILFNHLIAFHPKNVSNGSTIFIDKEIVTIDLIIKKNTQTAKRLMKIIRQGNRITSISTPKKFLGFGFDRDDGESYDSGFIEHVKRMKDEDKRIPPDESLLSVFSYEMKYFDLDILERIQVYELNPIDLKKSATPIPEESLERFGYNLPGTIRYLKDHEDVTYQKLKSRMKEVMPTFSEIEVRFEEYKTTQALLLKENGFKELWTADDVSDGTIQTIALLAAIYDPRTPLVVIEEPENSIHPWALRSFVEACRDASKTKQIILTTHSPIITEMLYPHEVWIVSRPESETNIDHLPTLDPDIEKHWKEGKITLWDYLDSGSVRQAVP